MQSAALLEGEDGEESMAFFRWFLEENEVENGMVDSVADIIKDQLFVNPLTFMDPSDPDQVRHRPNLFSSAFLVCSQGWQACIDIVDNVQAFAIMAATLRFLNKPY